MPPLLLKLDLRPHRVRADAVLRQADRAGASPRKVKALMVEPNLKRQLDFMEASSAGANGSRAPTSAPPTSR